MTKQTRNPSRDPRFARLASAYVDVCRQIDWIVIEGRGRIGALPGLTARRDAIVAEAALLHRHEGPQSGNEAEHMSDFYNALGIVQN